MSSGLQLFTIRPNFIHIGFHQPSSVKYEVQSLLLPLTQHKALYSKAQKKYRKQIRGSGKALWCNINCTKPISKIIIGCDPRDGSSIIVSMVGIELLSLETSLELSTAF